MTGQDFSVTKKSRGRPQGSVKPPTAPVRVPEALLSEIDAWAERQPEPIPSRSDAIRQLLEHALADGGPRPAPSVEQKIARAKRRIAKIAVPDEPSPRKGMAMLRRGKAEAGLAALKGKKGGKVKR